MTLDEAIKHAEEVAEENEKSLRGWKECINRGTFGWSDFDKEKVDTSITRCSKCAAEHRQLAEWLKDYKRLKEQELCDNAINRLEALKLADDLMDNLPDDDHLADIAMARNEGVLDYQTKLSLLPSVKWEDSLIHEEYYMVCNAEGSGYGGFETLEEAIKSLETQDTFNNDDIYDRVIKVVEIRKEVYRK